MPNQHFQASKKACIIEQLITPTRDNAVLFVVGALMMLTMCSLADEPSRSLQKHGEARWPNHVAPFVEFLRKSNTEEENAAETP